MASCLCEKGCISPSTKNFWAFHVANPTTNSTSKTVIWTMQVETIGAYQPRTQNNQGD